LTGYEWLCSYLEATGAHHQGHVWQCPAHEDASPSLAVNAGDGGVALFYCHAGCRGEDVIRALGLDWQSAMRGRPESPLEAAARLERFPHYPQVVYRSRGGSAAHGQPLTTAHHVYVQDEVRLERRRFADGYKEIRWEHREGPYWEMGLGGRPLSSLPLYMDAYVLQARALDEPIVLCESESSVDALIDAGIYATTWAGGAATPQFSALRASLTGSRVAWIPDNDPAGLKCSKAVVEALQEICQLAVIVPDSGQDARDLLTSTSPERLRDRIVREFDPVNREIAEATHPLMPEFASPTSRLEPAPDPVREHPVLSIEEVLCINALHRLIGQPLLPVPQGGPSVAHSEPDGAGSSARGRGDRTRTRSDIMQILVDLRNDDLGPRRSVLSAWLREPAISMLIGYREGTIRATARDLVHVSSMDLPRELVQALTHTPLPRREVSSEHLLAPQYGLRPEDRPRRRKDVLLVLFALRPEAARGNRGQLHRWRKDPELLEIRGFEVEAILRAGVELHGVRNRDFPAALARRMRGTE
jgi:hypothetical protein